MTKKYEFKVVVHIADEATADQVRQYIEDAVASWGGSYQPDDPFYSIRVLSVTRNVSRFKLPPPQG